MIEFEFNEFRIELSNESEYELNSTSNVSLPEKVYTDGKSDDYWTKHGIKIYKNEKLLNNALICANGGVTGVHENSAVIIENDILICCAANIFSLSLPELDLNWTRKIDDVTCFRIFNTENGIFIHGELEASKIDKSGNIIWSVGFADILVTPDGKDEFIIHKDFIEIEDWNNTKYRLDFDGNFI